MALPNATGANPKSGAEVAQISGPLTSGGKVAQSKSGGSAAGVGKFSPRYWKAKLFRKTWVDEEGKTRTVPEWRARMQLAGDRREVGLGTNDQEEASRIAARLFSALRSKGWDAALAEVVPDCRPQAKIERPTVGDWITRASEVFTGSPRTFAGYASSFRRIVVDLEGIRDASGRRFDWRAGGRGEWLAKVDATFLDAVKPAAVESWMARFVKSAAGNPLAMQRARRNANSFVRQARALFGRGIVRKIGLPAPSPMPFEGVALEPEGSTRYVATFDAKALMQAAQHELRDQDPEAWKAFLLLLCAGLRRGELDTLTWQQIDPKAHTVNVRTTDFFAPKTRTSERTVPLAPSIADEIEAIRLKSGGVFVIASRHQPTPHTKDRRYRCREVFARLVEWLRAHRVTADKPLHELRKEFGSIIAAQADLFTASRMLGHSNLDVTQRFYAEQRQRVTVDPMAAIEPRTNVVPMPKRA